MTAQATLDLIIDADYRAARTLGQFGGDLEKVGKKAGVANRALESTRKMMAGGLNVAGQVAKVGVIAVGAALGTAGLAASKFIAAGADVQESMSKFNVVFADSEGTVERVTKELDAFAKQSGRNKFALREMAGGLGDILKPLGFNVQEAGNLSVSLSKLAVDLGSFNNMAPEEAFERIRGTLIGSHENALEFGVVINEMTLKEELARMGADDLTGALLEQAKVQARINLLIAGTSDAQGDAIRTSESWTNQQLRLKSILEETSAEIGLKLIPALSPYLEMLGDLAAKWAPKAAEALGGLIDSFPEPETVQESVNAFIENVTMGEIAIGSFTFDFKGEQKSLSFGDFYQHEWGLREDGKGVNLKIGGLSYDNLTGDPQIGYGDLFTVKLTDDNKLLINGFSLGEWVKWGWSEILNPTIDDSGQLILAGFSLGDWAKFGFNALFGPDLVFTESGKILVGGVSLGDWTKFTIADLFENVNINDLGQIQLEFSWGGFTQDGEAKTLELGDYFKGTVTGDDGLTYIEIAGVKVSGENTSDTFAGVLDALAEKWKLSITESGSSFLSDIGLIGISVKNQLIAGGTENEAKWLAALKEGGSNVASKMIQGGVASAIAMKNAIVSAGKSAGSAILNKIKDWTPDWIDRLLSWRPFSGGGGGAGGPGGAGGGALPEAVPGESENVDGTVTASGLRSITTPSVSAPAFRAAGASRNITINISATLNNQIDQYQLAYAVADVLQRA